LGRHESNSFVAAQDVEGFVRLNEWQIGEIRKAIAEADRDDFATDEQVQHLLKRLRKKSGSKPLKGALKTRGLRHS